MTCCCFYVGYKKLMIKRGRERESNKVFKINLMQTSHTWKIDDNWSEKWERGKWKIAFGGGKIYDSITHLMTMRWVL